MQLASVRAIVVKLSQRTDERATSKRNSFIYKLLLQR